MIEIKNVTKTYNGIYKAVDDLNLEIEDGQIFGLLGPNGAGKTTTIKIIEDTIEAKEQFGYVPDNPDIFLKLTGLEYLNFMADIYNISTEDRQEIIRDLAERFNMEKALGDKIQSYSHGMRQKIVVMGVLVHRPRVWILDEPMTGLDPKSAYILKEMMREHARIGNTVLFSTHVLDVAEKLCDKVAIINKGQLIFQGTLEEMRHEFKSNDSLEKMFLEMTENE